MTASRSAPGRSSAWKKAFSGHSMRRVIPSSRLTVGRTAWKSTKPSGSMSAKRSASQLRREVRRRERRRLPAVVPAPERGDQDRAAERRPLVDAEVAPTPSTSVLGRRLADPCDAPDAVRASGSGGRQSACADRDRERPDRRRERHVHEHEPPRQGVAVLHLADHHLHEQHAEEHAGETDARPAATRRSRSSRQPTTRSPIPNTAVARTWTYTVSAISSPSRSTSVVARVRARGRGDRPRHHHRGAGRDAAERDHAQPARRDGRAEPARVAPGLEGDDHRERDDDEREQEVRHHGERVQLEDHGDPAERHLRDRAEERRERRIRDPARRGPATRRAASQATSAARIPPSATTRLPNSIDRVAVLPPGNGLAAARPVVAAEPRARQPHERAGHDDEPERDDGRPRAGESRVASAQTGPARATRPARRSSTASAERHAGAGLDAPDRVSGETRRGERRPRARRRLSAGSVIEQAARRLRVVGERLEASSRGALDVRAGEVAVAPVAAGAHAAARELERTG